MTTAFPDEPDPAGGAGAQSPSPPRSVAPPAMQAAAPGLADYTDDVLFGDVWKRPGLSPRDRSLLTVAALIAGGRVPQLTGHLGRALDNGVTPVEIAGIITHLAFYGGWPVAVSAVSVADDVFKAREVDRTSLRQAGEGLSPVPVGDAAVDGSLRLVAPGLAELTDRVLSGDVWRRRDLTPRDRSLVTVAALVAMGCTGPLAVHVPLALRNGLTREELGEAVTHLAFYAGWPRATAAVPFLAPTAAVPAPAAEAIRPLAIARAGSAAAAGPSSYFTGSVRVTAPFSGTDGARIRGACVSFEPGARTNWHTHPLGQTLIVVQGQAWVQQVDGPVECLEVGDTVFIPPGVKHWHGATRTQAMSHIALSEALDGKTVDWLEPVDDAQYGQGQG